MKDVESKYIGFIDTKTTTHIEGWAASLVDGVYKNTEIQLWVGREVVDAITPLKPRDDLKNANIGAGNFGFRVSADQGIDLSEVVLRFPNGVEIPLSETCSVDVDKEKLVGADEPIVSPSISIDNISITSTSLTSLLVWESTLDVDAFAAAKRICLYVTYNKYSTVDEFHLKQVAELRKAGYFVVAIRAAERFNAKSKSRLIGDVDLFKLNVGYDFGSWWVGHEWIKMKNREKISSLDSLCICNDSYFGQVSSPAIKKMHSFNSDAVGIADSHDHCHHLQSFFIIVKGQYLKSREFSRSLSSYRFPTEKRDVIRFGELLLSKNAIKSRVEILPYKKYTNILENWIRNIDTHVIDEMAARDRFGVGGDKSMIEDRFLKVTDRFLNGEVLNPTHIFWEEFIGDEVNIVKRELIFKNPLDIPNYYSLLEKCAEYSVVPKSKTSFEVSNGSVDIASLSRRAIIRKYASL